MHDQDKVICFQESYGHCPLLTLQQFFLRAWRHRLLREGLGYLRSKLAPMHSEKWAVQDCIKKASHADWWDWVGGSRIFFWRWPLAHQEALRRSHRVFVKGCLPRYRRPRLPEKDPEIKSKVTAKLANVKAKGYIEPGKVTSLTGFFAVPKGGQTLEWFMMPPGRG